MGTAEDFPSFPRSTQIHWYFVCVRASKKKNHSSQRFHWLAKFIFGEISETFPQNVTWEVFKTQHETFFISLWWIQALKPTRKALYGNPFKLFACTVYTGVHNRQYLMSVLAANIHLLDNNKRSSADACIFNGLNVVDWHMHLILIFPLAINHFNYKMNNFSFHEFNMFAS